MNKKIIYTCLVLSIMLFMPIISANGNISPEDIASYTSISGNDDKQLVTMDQSFDFDGTTVDVTTFNSTWVYINLNETFLIKVYQGDDYFSAVFERIQTPTNEFLLAIESNSFEYTNTSLIITLPDGMQIIASYNFIEIWTFKIGDFTISWQSEVNILDIFNTDIHVHIEEFNGYEQVIVNYFGILFTVYRWADRGWLINYFDAYTVNATYVAPMEKLVVTYQELTDPEIPVFGDFPASGAAFYQFDADSFTIAFIETVLIIAHDNFVVSIYEDKVVMDYVFVTVVVYLTTIIERIVVIFYEFTIVYYFIHVDLIVVIIWESIEIKVYYYQIVIVFEIIEILILIYDFYFEITITFHIDLWIVQLIFLIVIWNPIIVQPVIVRIVPILVPILVPMYFWVPVFINNYTYVYLPYLAEQLFIDISTELLEKPTHTIEYFIYDQAKNPITDANVNVEYNGSDYTATHQGSGIYRVLLPASDENEGITVTATKAFYPTATLTYTLEVNWTSAEEPTEEGSLPLIPVLVSLFTIAVSSIIINRKKRN
ncbi:MAG: hypothetical protein ACFFDW_11805 [Candidatus Thorarchaeota archaeon]